MFNTVHFVSSKKHTSMFQFPINGVRASGEARCGCKRWSNVLSSIDDEHKGGLGSIISN